MLVVITDKYVIVFSQCCTNSFVERKQVGMNRTCHNLRPQTNPLQCEEETRETNSHKITRKQSKFTEFVAVTCDFQQFGILTSVDSHEPVQPPFKSRNSK